jgi:hypothetical protein
VENSKDKLYLLFSLGFMIFLDLLVIGGLLYKGQANFIEVYKHLKI